MLWGERFDATGMVTEAGVATIDPTTGDLVIATTTAAPMTTDTVVGQSSSLSTSRWTDRA